MYKYFALTVLNFSNSSISRSFIGFSVFHKLANNRFGFGNVSGEQMHSLVSSAQRHPGEQMHSEPFIVGSMEAHFAKKIPPCTYCCHFFNPPPHTHTLPPPFDPAMKGPEGICAFVHQDAFVHQISFLVFISMFCKWSSLWSL
jgi:hypothetical protein